MLTAKEKRQRIIGNALYAYIRNDESWFNEVKNKMSLLLKDKSNVHKARIVLRWVQECETLAAPVVKDEIRKHFEV
jgi:hypothetical protein